MPFKVEGREDRPVRGGYAAAYLADHENTQNTGWQTWINERTRNRVDTVLVTIIRNGEVMHQFTESIEPVEDGWFINEAAQHINRIVDALPRTVPAPPPPIEEPLPHRMGQVRLAPPIAVNNYQIGNGLGNYYETAFAAVNQVMDAAVPVPPPAADTVEDPDWLIRAMRNMAEQPPRRRGG